MKKIYFLLLAGMIIMHATYAQKTIHDANAVVREAKNFHGIEIGGGIDLYLTQGNEEAVAVSAANDEYRDLITVTVVNGILKIGIERGSWKMNWGNRKMKAYVAIKNIDRLTAGGGSDVFLENELKADQLDLHFSGGSDFKGRVNTQELNIHVSGGSDAYISGKADKVRIIASGAGDIHAYDLQTNTAAITSSGGSDVHLTVNKELSAHASGGSDIYYKGSAIANTFKSGGGSIKKMN